MNKSETQTERKTDRTDKHGPYSMPQAIHEGLVAYKFDGRPTGGFLRTVIENDLTGAVSRADTESFAALHDICRWVYWEAPESSVGKGAYKRWTKAGGIVGQARAAIAKAQPQATDEATQEQE